MSRSIEDIKFMNEVDVNREAEDLLMKLEIIEKKLQMSDIDKSKLLKKIRECKTDIRAIIGNLE